MQKSQSLAQFVCLVFVSEQVLKSPIIQSTNKASYSCILTMANYMSEVFPELPPPLFPKQLIVSNEQKSRQQKKAMKLYFEPWCDYFNTYLNQNGNGEIAEKNGTMYLIAQVSNQYFTSIKQIFSNSQFQLLSNNEFDEKFKIIKQKKNGKNIRVGIINFALSQLKNDAYNPKVNLLSLFAGIWYKCGDDWKKYDVLRQNYPTEDDIMNTDVFILSGSTISVNDQNKHVQKVMHILKQGIKKNKKLKLLGLCFGHQAIIKYFGGQVQRKQLYSGLQIINFSQQVVNQYKFLQKIKQIKNPSPIMFQFHNDYVTKIPDGFKRLAASNSCSFESTISDDSRILTFQFHNEYTYGYIQQFQIKIKQHFKQDLYKTDYQMRKEPLEKYGINKHLQSCKVIRQTARKFIQLDVLQ